MSTNIVKSAVRNEGDSVETDEKPGMSSSLFRHSNPNPKDPTDNSDEFSSEGLLPVVGDETPDNTPVKFRNASRDRPIPTETPLPKRLKVEGDNDQNLDPGIHMDTDSSSNSGDEKVNSDENIDVDAFKSDSLPPKSSLDFENSRKGQVDEDVSTTVITSVVKTRPSRLNELISSPNSHLITEGDPIASTSAAISNSAFRQGSSATVESLHQVHFDVGMDLRNEVTAAESFNARMDSLPISRSTTLQEQYLPRRNEIDENENRESEAFLDKMHGQQRLMWARKLFFLSTEFVFPGFTAYSDSKNQIPDYMGVRVRSSCMMQALLYADSLFFIMWILSFLSTCDILITVLKELHGYLAMCLTCLFIVVNILRLRFGLKGNENDEVQYLALFWMTTVIVQIPLFTFIFLTDLFCPVLMAFTVTMDGTLMAFILVESIIGFIHFRSLLRDELNIIKMARRSKEASQSCAGAKISKFGRQELGTNHEFGISKPEFAKYMSQKENDSSSSDLDSDNEGDRLHSRKESMDFRMQIRRLSGVEQAEREQIVNEDDSDSSEQVSSTSDTIRQRPIKAH